MVGISGSAQGLRPISLSSTWRTKNSSRLLSFSWPLFWHWSFLINILWQGLGVISLNSTFDVWWWTCQAKLYVVMYEFINHHVALFRVEQKLFGSLWAIQYEQLAFRLLIPRVTFLPLSCATSEIWFSVWNILTLRFVFSKGIMFV